VLPLKNVLPHVYHSSTAQPNVWMGLGNGYIQPMQLLVLSNDSYKTSYDLKVITCQCSTREGGMRWCMALQSLTARAVPC